MSFGTVSNLYVIGRYLYKPFFNENFRNSDVFNDFIEEQSFTREISSGAIDLSAFTDVSETYTVTDLIFKLNPRNSSDIDIELKYSGSVVFTKTNSSDSHYTSFSTTGLTPTIKITDTRNGGNSVLTNLFTFSQINISGTGYFETVNDVINIGLGTDDVNLRYDTLDIDYTNASNEAIGIDFNSQSVDNYIVTKTVNGTLVETSSIGVDNGEASFSISGTTEGGNTLSISQDAADPDGTGALSYSWQISSDNSTWSEVGTSSTYAIADSDQGKKIRAVISYTDNEGHSEQITTVSKDIFFTVADNTTEGITASGGSGNDLLIGSRNNDTLKGLDGNDEIYGGDGDDNIEGGYGDDTIYGGGGNDTLYGNEGTDAIYGGDGNDQIYAGSSGGAETSNTNEQLIDAGSGDDRMYIRSGSKNVKILAGDGDDHIDGDFRYLDAGSGDDFIEIYSYGYQVDYFDGGTGTDELMIIPVGNNSGTGSSTWGYAIKNVEKITFRDSYYANLGDQAAGDGEGIEVDASTRENSSDGTFTVGSTFEGDITFKGSAGVDIVTLGKGDDVLTLGSGDDIVYSGLGSNTIDGGEGEDTVIYSGTKDSYTIQYEVSNLFETISVSKDSNKDLLTSIKTISFSDADVQLEVTGRTIKDSGQGIFAPISGDPIIGGTITAGAITDDPDGVNSNPNIFYQWQEASYTSNTWTDISGANSSTYSPQSGDSNKTLRVKATYSDGTGIRSSVYSDPVNIYSQPLPNVSFNQVASDNTINNAEKVSGVNLTGQDDGREVTITFAGITRKATSSGGTWSYTLTDGDWKNLVNGTNIFTATFSKEGEQILEKSQSVNIASDITLTQSSQSIDRTQPKGLSIASQSFLDDDGKLLDYDQDGEADVYQPDIAILPWTTAEQFNLGSDADQTNIAAIKVQSTYSLKGIEVFDANNSQYSIPLSNGTSYTVSVDSQYQTTYDPIAFNISGLEPGSTINADIYLPSSFSSANTYLRYNYIYNDFRPYVGSNGNALYSFDTSDPNNKKVTLTLTDGDPHWDGDGTKNGRIVDPGMPVNVTDTGDASFSISGNLQVGHTLTVNQDSADPDGSGTDSRISYSWQRSINTTEWEEVGTQSSYTITSNEVGKKIRTVLSYQDGNNNNESIIVDPGMPVTDTNPTLTTSEISNDGSKLILTFSENIYLAPGATFSALQVTVDGTTNNPVTAVNTANAELQATLSDKILYGQQITLDYSHSTQTVQDSTGNYLSSVTSQSVTNNSNVIGYINGATYEGDFHVMDGVVDGGMKMTGASHGAGTDQIIYSTVEESM